MPTQYRPEIDGLRAIAVALVVFFHAKFAFAGAGFLGVDIFFVISGYLISTLIFKDIAKGQFSLLTFYERRARRLLPALFLVMATALILGWYIMPIRQWDSFSESVIWTSLFGSNIFFWQDVDYFGPAADLKPLLHSWSLAVEEQFYLIFPLIAIVLARKKNWFYAGLLLLGALSFAACLWAASNMPRASFYLAPFRFWEFLIGVFCAVWLTQKTRQDANPLILQIGAGLGLVLIFIGLWIMGDVQDFSAHKMLVPVTGTALVILFARDRNWIQKLLGFKPLVWLGLISYSLYLWHYVLFAFARIKLGPELELAIVWLLIVASVALSAFTWFFIEQPFRNKNSAALTIGKRTLLPTRRAALIAAFLGIAGFSTIGYLQTNGQLDPGRFAIKRAHIKNVKALATARKEYIQYGRCDFHPVTEWKGRWDCGPESENGARLNRINVAVIGDSHAADKAMILRLQGFEPVQFTGGACKLDPENMSRKCREFFDFARLQLGQMPEVEKIWLSQSFRAGGLKPEAMDRTLKFWSETGKKIVLFSNMPKVSRTKHDWTKNAESLAPELWNIYSKYGAQIIDVRTILCADDGTCPTQIGNSIFYVDADHLSPPGAKYAGDRLMKIRPDLKP